MRKPLRVKDLTTQPFAKCTQSFAQFLNIFVIPQPIGKYCVLFNMRKICLTVVGLYCLLLHAFAQHTRDTSAYKARRLKLDEVNLVSSYYNQTGDHSAIQGGIGSEKVTDLANGLELKFVGLDTRLRKHTLTAGLGLDHHTAASQAYISKTGASRTGGTRIYPSLDWTVDNEQKGRSFSLGAYYSREYNYHSLGLNTGTTFKTRKNGEFGIKLSAYFDEVKMIRPSEFNTVDTISNNTGGSITYTTASGRTVTLSSGSTYTNEESVKIPSSPRQTYTSSFSFTQIIDTRLQVSLLADLVYQHGYLGLPFHRVYFTDATDTVEHLPSTRFKLPLGLRVNYFLGDNFIIRAYYRYYQDDWGIHSHTASIETPVKISSFFSVAPFYRYYIQTAADYFAAYGLHQKTDIYYTSNYALSSFTSHYFGANLRVAPPAGIFHSTLKILEIRYGHYTQTTDLASDVVSLSLTFK